MILHDIRFVNFLCVFPLLLVRFDYAKSFVNRFTIWLLHRHCDTRAWDYIDEQMSRWRSVIRKAIRRFFFSPFELISANVVSRYLWFFFMCLYCVQELAIERKSSNTHKHLIVFLVGFFGKETSFFQLIFKGVHTFFIGQRAVFQNFAGAVVRLCYANLIEVTSANRNVVGKRRK